ncbi:MAG: ParB N-terminal domain-containing protein, partial [Oscillospiraceae bacterium]
MAVKKGLGKGLDALFMDNDTMSEERSALTVKITEIEPNRLQPRKSFDEESLQQLADSIREHGVIQPILVRP